MADENKKVEETGKAPAPPVVDQSAELEKLKAENSMLSAKVEALETTVSEQPAKGKDSGLPTFTVKTKRYQFKIPGFSFDGNTATLATEAVKDKDLLAKIVEEYPGLVEAL